MRRLYIFVMKEYMSGSELRQYLHISTRKMKYLMDHNYIPHENTGQATHKYRVRREDAEAFKWRMDYEEGFLSELTGQFSNRKPYNSPRKGRTSSPSAYRPVLLLEPTEENCSAFNAWLTREWAELPDALPSQQIVKLIGGRPQQIHELVRKGRLHSVTVMGKQYCVKSEIIDYISSPEKVGHPAEKIYQELIRKYKRWAYKERMKEKQNGQIAK